MFKKIIFNLSLFCLCFVFSLNAQDSKLTIEKAIQLALKNNYDILISKNQAVQATNNNSLGNAGMLPKIDLNASGSFANNATKQEFSSGLIVDKNGVQSQNITTGAYLNWTLFDGLKMFATHDKLQHLQNMGELNLEIQIENTIVQVTSAYYKIVIMKQFINGIKENILVSEERLKIAQKKFDLGSVSKVDVIQAKLDLNELRSVLIRQKTLMEGAKEELNQLLVQNIDQELDVDDSIPVMNQFKYEDLKNAIVSDNSDLLFAQKNIEVSKYMVKEVKSSFYPKLNLNASYIFNRAQNQAGFALFNQNLGMNLGFTVSWTIFNGLNTLNNVKNMKLNLENSNFEYENLKSLTHLLLLKAFKKYQDDINIVQLEEENNMLAKENLEISLDRFRLGVTTSIEIKMAQSTFQNSITRLSDAHYAAKNSEIQLLKLSGKILK